MEKLEIDVTHYIRNKRKLSEVDLAKINISQVMLDIEKAELKLGGEIEFNDLQALIGLYQIVSELKRNHWIGD